MDLLNSTSFRLMEAGLRAANIRQNVISNNIANEETPYFKRSDVSFENLLQQEMNDGAMPRLRGKVTDPRHFVIGPLPIRFRSRSSPRAKLHRDEQ